MRGDVDLVEYRRGSGDYRDAATYDTVRYVGRVNEWKDAVMTAAYSRLLGPVDRLRVLDVGCGTGRGAVRLVNRGARAVGVDASVDMLAIASAKAGRSPFVAGYAQRLPFADESFDVVITLNFLHLFGLEVQHEMVAEMQRVLRPGGVLLIELDNALHGGLVGLYKRWRGIEQGSLPGEIRYILGPGCRVVRIHGAVFPLVWRLLARAPDLGAIVERLGWVPPFNRLAHRIYYRAVKLDRGVSGTGEHAA